MYDHHEPTEAEMDHQIWSDLHKDVYGFRPRGPVPKDLAAEMQRLQAELVEVMAEERRRRLSKQKEIKAYVRECMATGMTGLRALEEHFRMVRADHHYGWEDYCYLMGIGYALEHYLARRKVFAPGPGWGE